MFRSHARAAAATLFLALALLAPGAARGQEPVPTDHAAALYRAALALESEGSYDLADALMDYILRRYPDSEEAAVIRRARSRVGSRRVDSSGRTELVVWSTLYGLWLGVAVPAMLGAEEAGPYGAGLVVGGPLAFGAALAATRHRPISDGAASAMTFGGTWGTWQGFGWAQVLGTRERCLTDPYVGGSDCYDDGPSAPTVFASMVAGGVAGLATGIAVARSHDITPGQASTATLAASWGTWYGLAFSVLTGLDSSDHGALTGALVGGDVGLLAGTLFARRHSPTRSAARLVSIAGVAGGLAGLGVDLMVQPSNDRVAVAIPAIGSTIGLVVAAAAMRGRDTRTGRDGAAPDDGGEWQLGGPLLPVFRKDDDGRLRPGVSLTLVSARF